jgi:non-ribosomal peptide synthetase component F
LQTILAAMMEDERQEIGEIELLPEAERRQVLYEWNDTGREVGRGTLVELFEQQAERRPEGVAIRHGEVTLSYRELDERSNRLAHYLRAQGVRGGGVVGVGAYICRWIRRIRASGVHSCWRMRSL